MKDNILIAKFMGWYHDEKHDLWYSPEMMKQTSMREATLDMYFHKSWDWLMPVVEKIEKLGVTTQIWYAAGSKTYNTWILGLSYVYDSTDTFPSKIESVYSAVVKFIKWYNKQSKK